MSNKATQFKPGESGNPDGRPKKGYSITEWFKEMLDSSPEVKDAIGKSITKKALEGDTAAQKLVWSYMDGMPKQSTDLTTNGKDLIPTFIVSTKESKEELEQLYKESDERPNSSNT